MIISKLAKPLADSARSDFFALKLDVTHGINPNENKLSHGSGRRKWEKAVAH